MYLFIYTTHPDTSWIALRDTREGRPIKRKIRKGKSGRGDTLKTIDQLLAALKLSPGTIRGIAVCTGPGHFTSLRTSVVIANTFGWTMDIPVVGLEAADEKEFISAGAKALSRKKRFSPVIPMYGKEPTISSK